MKEKHIKRGAKIDTNREINLPDGRHNYRLQPEKRMIFSKYCHLSRNLSPLFIAETTKMKYSHGTIETQYEKRRWKRIEYKSGRVVTRIVTNFLRTNIYVLYIPLHTESSRIQKLGSPHVRGRI